MELEIINTEEKIFEFDTFELALHPSGNYILCEEGYFAVDGLESFKPFNDQFVIINEENEKFFIDSNEFEKIKKLYTEHA